MMAPKRRGQALISVLVLAIACTSSPSRVFAFLPHSRPSQEHNDCSSTLSRHNYRCVQQRDFGHQRYCDTMMTRTARKTTETTLNLSPELLAGAASLVAGFAGWLYIDGASDRDRRKFRAEEEARIEAIQQERAKRAYIEPKEYWTEAELAPYDGSQDEDGPILMAADGLVFNVYKGRNFYLPGCEYHIFAGRDATRLLARNKLEEETEEEAAKPLNIAERAFLATWMYTFKGKYDIVGKLEGFDPQSTAM